MQGGTTPVWQEAKVPFSNFRLSPNVSVESPRSDAQTAKQAAESRPHDRVQSVSGNCWVPFIPPERLFRLKIQHRSPGVFKPGSPYHGDERTGTTEMERMSDTASIFDQGASLVPDLITEPDERRILLRIGEAPWLAELSRRVQHYGYRYDYRARASGRHVPAAPFPRWASVVAERLAPWFGGAAPEQCIVNEYRPGQGIGMHADHAVFGPVVVSLSLGDDWPMRFRRRSVHPYARDALPDDGVAVLPRRSALVLAGPARTGWMHGIDRDDGRRAACVSATFRTLARSLPGSDEGRIGAMSGDASATARCKVR